MEEIANRVIQGNTLNVLAQMPNNSIDCIITSPPYYGLRDYGEQSNTIWNEDKDCEHEWVINSYKRRNSDSGDNKNKWSDEAFEKLRRDRPVKYAFCDKCNAFFGQLGLEPTLDLYLKHMLQITAELKRVLKPTGIFWLNHGDSYNSSPSGLTHEKAHEWGEKGDGLFKRLHSRHSRGMTDKPTPKKELKNVPAKCLLMQNYRLAMAMVDQQGWILRNHTVWHKTNPMPESVKDRLSSTWEPVFMFSKKKQYWFDLDAIREPLKTGSWDKMPPIGGVKHTKGNKNPTYSGNQPASRLEGKNPGDHMDIPTQSFSEAHFAVFPEKLVDPMIKDGCPKEICQECGFIRERVTEVERKSLRPGISSKYNDGQTQYSLEHNLKKVRPIDRQTTGWTSCECDAEYKSGIVLDPFMGAGTTAVVAEKLGRQWIGIEIVKEYVDMSYSRLAKVNPKYRKFVSDGYYNQKIEKDKKQSEEKGQKLLF